VFFARRPARTDTGAKDGGPGRAADAVETAVPAADEAVGAVADRPPLDPAAAAIADEIRTLVGVGVISLPPLPQVATRLLRLLSDEDADINTAGQIIENDPALAASVLRMANSASFGGLRELSDPAEAVGRLGLRQVSTLVTAVAHRNNFECSAPARVAVLRKLWDHAVASALLARRFAMLNGGDAPEAFLGGLLHDTGKLLVLRAVDHLITVEHHEIEAEQLETLMTALHCELGGAALKQWKIADAVCEAARRHHDPDVGEDETLILCVQLSSEVARKMGADLHPDKDLDVEKIPAVARLGLGAADVETMMMDAEDEFQRVRQMFA
jgi:HD-like signal output (HDOD) protein